MLQIIIKDKFTNTITHIYSEKQFIKKYFNFSSNMFQLDLDECLKTFNTYSVSSIATKEELE